MRRAGYTRQGVRDLGGNDRRPPRRVRFGPLRQCPHRRMNWCCAPRYCGHLLCRDCGLTWDVAAEC